VLCLGLPLVSVAGSLPFFVAALVTLGMGNGLLDVSMSAHAARASSSTRPTEASGLRAPGCRPAS